jgi:hypothetical protein
MTTLAAALDIAARLIDAGVPVFAAKPARDEDGKWDPAGGTGECGYWLPDEWQKTVPAHGWLDPSDPHLGSKAWRPDWALCAVMGHRLDLIDVDPRNGGDVSYYGLDGQGPTVYARASTPSGGWHEFVAVLGVHSRDGILPGVDLKAGDPSGKGRGFAFIAPTVKLSKATGEITGYVWTMPPDNLPDGPDGTGDALRELVNAARGGLKSSSPEDEFLFGGVPLDGPIPAGERDATLFKYASRLRGKGMAKSEAEHLLRLRWQECEQPAGDEFTWEQAAAKLGQAWEKYEAPADDSVNNADNAVTSDSPIPLSGEHHALSPFPVDALPGWLAEHVAAVAHATQTPPDMAGTLGVGMLAACAGGRAVVEVRPGWREPTNLYVVTAISSGNRKSVVHEVTCRPLRVVEAELTEQMRSVVIEADAAKKIAQKEAERALSAASNAKSEAQRNELTADAVAAAQLAEAITVPLLPRLLADDVTPEAAASLLADHGGRLAISSAEGGIFGSVSLR